MNKILIIGASGFLGNFLFNNLSKNNIFGTYYKTKKRKLFYLNLKNYESIKKILIKLKPNIIIYTAGITDTDWSENNKKYSYYINAYIVKYILQLNLKCKFVYFSTDYVFDGTKKNYENSKINPINTYGKSKALGEFFVKKYSNNYIIFRVTGLYHHKLNKNKSSFVVADDNRFSNPIHINDILNVLKNTIYSNIQGIVHLFGQQKLSRYEFEQLININSNFNKKVIPSYYNSNIKKPINSNMKTNKKHYIHYCIKNINHYYTYIKYVYTKDALDIFLEKNNIQIIFIDTIGGLLTKRRWKKINDTYKEIDNICGNITRENIHILNKYNIPFQQIAKNISSIYTINPYMWEKIKKWKRKYILILINNGWNETFNLWNKKYGFYNYFDEVINSYESNIRKENPCFFKNILNMYKINPQKSLLFDDDKEIIKLAKKQQIKTFLMYHKKDFPLDKYEVEI